MSTSDHYLHFSLPLHSSSFCLLDPTCVKEKPYGRPFGEINADGTRGRETIPTVNKSYIYSQMKELLAQPTPLNHDNMITNII